MSAPSADTSGVFVPRLTSPALAGALAIALAAGLSACDATPASAPKPPQPAAASNGYAFGGTDRAWIEINIAMNEELLPLLDLVPSHSRDKAVQDLAAQVRAGHDKELEQLRTFHDEARLPSENPHKGMPMPGMMTPELLAQASKIEGPAFDKFFRARLREHLQQGINLAKSENKAGVEPRSKQLATDMITGRTQFLTRIGTPPNK